MQQHRAKMYGSREKRLDILKNSQKLCKPRNENVLSTEYYGDNQTTENEIDWTC
jgi:hypothetical protein